MTRERTSKQEEIGSQPTASTQEILRIKKIQQEGDRRLQDALEDDDVREALKSLHSRDKSN